MNELVKVKRCYLRCPLYSNSMDGMQCMHPYWDGKDVYDRMIITQENSRNGKIPEKCPLRSGPLNRTYILRRKN